MQALTYVSNTSSSQAATNTSIAVTNCPAGAITDTCIGFVPSTGELFTFTGASGINVSGNLTGCVRGIGGTTAATIANGAFVGASPCVVPLAAYVAPPAEGGPNPFGPDVNGATLGTLTAEAPVPGAATLVGAINSTATTITVTQGVPTSLPGEAPFLITIGTEQMYVSGITGPSGGVPLPSSGAPGVNLTLTVIRGYNGTTAASASSGAPVTYQAIPVH